MGLFRSVARTTSSRTERNADRARNSIFATEPAFSFTPFFCGSLSQEAEKFEKIANGFASKMTAHHNEQ
jgi:hypothetical protein